MPAVFGVTTDPFLAFTSNGFAILGLRSLYTLVASAVAEFEYLRPAIAAVLAFIGFKLIGGYLGFEAAANSNLRPTFADLDGPFCCVQVDSSLASQPVQSVPV